MTFVMDASVTASWCFPDESSSVAERAFERLLEESAAVPAHWWFELRNVLLVGERRERIDERQIARFLRLVSGLPIEIDRAPDEVAIFSLARRQRLTFYDAAYLELARRHEALASLDVRLVEAARAEGVRLTDELGSGPIP
jgi:predicted nucleic acid-binding protein